MHQGGGGLFRGGSGSQAQFQQHLQGPYGGGGEAREVEARDAASGAESWARNQVQAGQAERQPMAGPGRQAGIHSLGCTNAAPCATLVRRTRRGHMQPRRQNAHTQRLEVSPHPGR